MTQSELLTPSADLGGEDKGSAGYLYLVAAVAAIGGLLFGFDTAVISGAIVFMKKQWILSDKAVGWAVGCAQIGCIIGCCFAGSLSDKFGRKKGLLLAAIIFTVSAVGMAIPRNMIEFSIARILSGVGVGVASMLSPVYIAEIAPARIRGRLVTINQLAIIFGMLVTYVANWSLVDVGPDNWRWMLGSVAAPSAIFLVALIFVPESPRWLAKQGLEERALTILARVGGRQHAQQEMVEIQEAIRQEAGTVRELFRPGLRTALIIGVVLAIFTQVTGINTILYYAPSIFQSAGYANEASAFRIAIFMGVGNVVFSAIAVLIIDKLGRKRILALATGGMGVFLLLLGFAFRAKDFPPLLTSAIVMGYVAFFMVGFGPGFWALVSEIFPTRLRGRAMSIVTVILWGATSFVAQTFPSLVAKLGSSTTYWIYAAMCVVAFVFILKMVPETKGKTLEQIEGFWSR